MPSKQEAALCALLDADDVDLRRWEAKEIWGDDLGRS